MCLLIFGLSCGSFPNSYLQSDHCTEFPHFFDVEIGMTDEVIAEFDGIPHDRCNEVDRDEFANAIHAREDTVIRDRILDITMASVWQGYHPKCVATNASC